MAKSFGFRSVSVSLTMLQTNGTGIEGGEEVTTEIDTQKNKGVSTVRENNADKKPLVVFSSTVLEITDSQCFPFLWNSFFST